MEVVGTHRERILAALIPFVRAAASMDGVRRIAIVGSLLTAKERPKDVDLLVSIEDHTELSQLATAGRRLLGRMLQCGNVGCDIFLASPQHSYLGRLCQWRECYSGRRRSCDALHCGQRPYLHDDLHSITLKQLLVSSPPLELWPTIVTRVSIPSDVEQALLAPLGEELGLQRREEIVPRSVHNRLYRHGMVNQVELEVLQTVARFFNVMLSEDLFCNLVEIRPVESYATVLHFPDISFQITGIWAVEMANASCFVVQGIQAGQPIYLVR